MAAFTCSSVWAMSAPQVKNKSTSAEPRLVVDRTFSRAGTLFTASSIGRVMVTSIWSIGMTPLATPMMIRGKLVEGNTAMGIESASYTPTATRTKKRKRIDFECGENQKCEGASGVPGRGGYAAGP